VSPSSIGRTARQGALEFPGCHEVRITRSEIKSYEGRIEYWDADTEMAMVCEPVTLYHERPTHRLTALASRISETRGSPIEACGAADLLLRDRTGAWRRILEADQILFLHAERLYPSGARVEVRSGVLPEVVLEVDYSTDVRRGKLSLYEEWGFPEVWVEVPDARADRRGRSPQPGLTIHVLTSAGYCESPTSLAFPGWTVAEIHRALNERTMSVETAVALRRVGRILGERENTTLDDDPFLREERRESRQEGRGEMLRNMLVARGIPLSADFEQRLIPLVRRSNGALADAAMRCRDEEDFFVRAGGALR